MTHADFRWSSVRGIAFAVLLSIAITSPLHAQGIGAARADGSGPSDPKFEERQRREQAAREAAQRQSEAQEARLAEARQRQEQQAARNAELQRRREELAERRAALEEQLLAAKQRQRDKEAADVSRMIRTSANIQNSINSSFDAARQQLQDYQDRQRAEREAREAREEQRRADKEAREEEERLERELARLQQQEQQEPASSDPSPYEVPGSRYYPQGQVPTYTTPLPQPAAKPFGNLSDFFSKDPNNPYGVPGTTYHSVGRAPAPSVADDKLTDIAALLFDGPTEISFPGERPAKKPEEIFDSIVFSQSGESEPADRVSTPEEEFNSLIAAPSVEFPPPLRDDRKRQEILKEMRKKHPESRGIVLGPKG